jgi:hypothetical protein
MQFIIFVLFNRKSIPKWSTMIQIRDFSLIWAHVLIRPWCTDFVILTNSTFSYTSNVTGILSRILKYSQLCGWELGSSGPWRHVTGWSVGNVYKEHSAFVFKDLVVRKQYVLLGTQDPEDIPAKVREVFSHWHDFIPKMKRSSCYRIKLIFTYFLLFLFILLLLVL